jgi:hypothetical protein
MSTFDHWTRRRPAMRRAVPLVIAVGLLLAAACSNDDGSPRANTESIDTTEASSESDASGGDGEAESTGRGSGSDSDEILGTARAEMRANAIDNRSTPLRIDVTRLERHGELVELTLVLTNEAPEAPTDDSDPQDFSADDMFGGSYDASGIGLVDGDAQKLYLPVLDSEDNCLCTDGFGANEVPPGGTMTIEATYGGVPDDVEQLDVSVPNFPAIVGVPIQ